MARRPPSYRPTPFLLGSAGLHAAGAVALALWPGRWSAIVGAVLADHLAIAAAGLWPQSRLLGANLSRLPAAAARRGEIALTFDDGPDPAVTPRVLEQLERRGARATFFCIGRRAERHPEIVAEAVRRGHAVENHTWSHPLAFACYPPHLQRREVRRAQEALALAAGRPPAFFRAPAGLRNPGLDWALHGEGLALASWTRRGLDTVSRRPAQVARRLLSGLAAGDVLLLHDGSAARDRHGVPVVLEVLPRLLDEVAARGLRPVPLPAAVAGGEEEDRLAG
jgi:peptidoglycan/xylan/chitin deacetylase (PgdA/CDA1 family)